MTKHDLRMAILEYIENATNEIKASARFLGYLQEWDEDKDRSRSYTHIKQSLEIVESDLEILQNYTNLLKERD